QTHKGTRWLVFAIGGAVLVGGIGAAVALGGDTTSVPSGAVSGVDSVVTPTPTSPEQQRPSSLSSAEVSAEVSSPEASSSDAEQVEPAASARAIDSAAERRTTADPKLPAAAPPAAK